MKSSFKTAICIHSLCVIWTCLWWSESLNCNKKIKQHIHYRAQYKVFPFLGLFLCSLVIHLSEARWHKHHKIPVCPAYIYLLTDQSPRWSALFYIQFKRRVREIKHSRLSKINTSLPRDTLLVQPFKCQVDVWVSVLQAWESTARQWRGYWWPLEYTMLSQVQQSNKQHQLH